MRENVFPLPHALAPRTSAFRRAAYGVFAHVMRTSLGVHRSGWLGVTTGGATDACVDKAAALEDANAALGCTGEDSGVWGFRAEEGAVGTGDVGARVLDRVASLVISEALKNVDSGETRPSISPEAGLARPTQSPKKSIRVTVAKQQQRINRCEK